MTDVKHEIPEDLQPRYEVVCDYVKRGTRVAAMSSPWVKGIIERIAQLTADLAECKRDFFEADSLRATFEEQVERLSAPVSDEEWSKDFPNTARHWVNYIIANRAKQPK